MSKKASKTTFAGRFLKAAGVVLLGLILLAAAYLFLAPLTERYQARPVEGSESWMSRLDDSLRLNEISIPGTHDCGTQYVQLAYFSKCQASDIATQLADGYRYLDIRLGAAEGKDGTQTLFFYHGFCRCRTGFLPWVAPLTLEDALKDCYAFLTQNPTETILFNVKQEQGSDTALLQSLLDDVIQNDPGRWLLTDSLPTLGEARGKLVLLRRYDDAACLGVRAGLYLNWQDQGGRDDTGLHAAAETLSCGRLIVQDRYKYEAFEKWTAFLAGMAEGTGAADEIRLHFLSTNGSPKFGHPYAYAETLNLFLETEDLSSFPPSWIIVDFSDAELAKTVYGLNFR